MEQLSAQHQKFKLENQTYYQKMQSQQKEQNREQSFDEKPIGATQKQQQMMSQYPADFNADQLNMDSKPEPLPLNKRIHSKVWKIRKQAFQQLLSEVTENWAAYQQYLKDTVTFITDPNPLCQQRALKILAQYLNSAPNTIQEPRVIIKGLLEKCLVVQKGEIPNIATEIMYWFMDNYQQVLLNEVNENILNKNPKICASTLAFLQRLLNNYGARKLKMLDQFGKSFTLLSSSVRPVAKQQSISLFKEMFKWMGDAALGFSIHPQVKDEVVKFSKTYVKEPMVIKRGLNEDQKKGKKPLTQSADDDENQQPQDVLSPYDSRWVDKVLEQAKWKDKKALLDEFIKKTKVKNIISRQSSHYITLIKRLLSDNNINLLQCGFRVIKNLCTGLKKNFTHPCKVVLTPIFSKLRDTKAMIVDEAHQVLEAMMNCLIIDDFIQDIKEGLKDKAPNMRFQTLRFIQKILSRRDKKMMPSFKNLTAQIVDLNEDGASEVREKTIDVLCKLKSVYGLNFFGDKLKKIQGKKLQTIQNYVDPNENRIDQQPMQQKNHGQIGQKQMEKKTIKTAYSPIKQNSQQQSQGGSSKSALTEPVSKINAFNVNSDWQSASQSVRQQMYQNLHQKPPQIIQQQLVEAFKNKQPMIRQSNPAILKLILACVKKSVHHMVGLEHMELLLFHDWKKCKPLLIQFIHNSKLNLSALELVKNQGILASAQPLNSKRNLHADRAPEKQIISNSQPHQSNFGSSSNSQVPYPIISSQNSLKLFYTSIQGLIPKMSNPDPVVRLQAVQTALQLLRPIAAGAPLQSPEPNPAISEAISQLFNVLKYRIQDSNEQISNNYINLVTEMLTKGFLNKYRTPGRLLMSMLIQKINNPHLTNLEHFLKQMVTNNSVVLWQFLATELSKDSMCNSVLNIIKNNNQSFFKNGDQKTYVLPLLTCISKDLQTQKCGELLDQIVEINGQQILQKVVRESKISGFNVESYLKKWHISGTGSHSHTEKLKQHNNNQSNCLIGTAPIMHSKLERINSELQNPWPLTPSASHIIKIMSQMLGMGQPFQSLASPTLLTQSELSMISNIRNQVIEDNSDILTKWIFWRIHIESQPKNIQYILNLIYKIVTIGFELEQSEIVIILGTMASCLNLHKSQYLKQIIRINQFLNQHPLYKQKAFRFWINSFNDPTSSADEILNLIVHSFHDMIPSELVTLARFPVVVRNKQFNEYLRSNYNQKLLTVYGFKLQDVEKKNIISEHLNQQMTTEVESKYFIEMFQRSSSTDLVQKIASDTSNISSQFVMEAHLKIMHSIIVPYLHRQLSFINVYNYFKYVQKIMMTANSSPFLLNLVRTLSYFLIDLDEIKLENYSQMLKTINKLLLILLEISEPKHILEVLFIMMKQQLKNGGNAKLSLLLPKCIGKVIKNPLFKSQYERREQNAESLDYIAKELIEILCTYQISNDSSLMKTIKNQLNEMTSLFPKSICNLQKLMETGSQNMPERVKLVIQEIIRDKPKQNMGMKKIDNSYISSENSYVQSKDIKNAGNIMKALKSVVGEHGVGKREVEKQKMSQ